MLLIQGTQISDQNSHLAGGGGGAPSDNIGIVKSFNALKGAGVDRNPRALLKKTLLFLCDKFERIEEIDILNVLYKRRIHI